MPCALTLFRKVPLKQSREKTTVNGLPPLNEFLPHHQQIVVSARQDNSASTEETSASSGMCQCRCTCGGERTSTTSYKLVFCGYGFIQLFKVTVLY